MSAPSKRKREKQRKREQKKKTRVEPSLNQPASEKEKQAGVLSLVIMGILIVASTIFIFSRMS